MPIVFLLIDPAPSFASAYGARDGRKRSNDTTSAHAVAV
jgi:hypothetical protein